MKALLSFALLVLVGTAAFAQPPGGGRNAVLKDAPAPGDLLPDITVFKSDGSPLKLRSLRGSHSVIIFGCLT